MTIPLFHYYPHNMFSQHLHRQNYANKLTEELKSIREKELHDANKKRKDTFMSLQEDIETTMENLKKNNSYEQDIATYERDRRGYINIFRLEARSTEKEIRRINYFKEKKNIEEKEKQITKENEETADETMTDPIQKELQLIKKQINQMQQKQENKIKNKKGHKNNQKHNNNNNKEKNDYYPKGQRRGGYNQPQRRNYWNQSYKKFGSYNNNERKNYYNNWRNSNNDWRNNNNDWRNNRIKYHWRRNNNPIQQRNESGNGNQGPRHRYTNSTNQSGSRPNVYREKQNLS